MKFFRRLLIGAFFLTFLLPCAQAQQIQNRPIQTGLLLEVVFLKGLAPAYQKVPWAEDNPSGAWYARFDRTPGWQLPAGDLPIYAVRVVSSLQGDVVTVNVSILRGKFHDTEQPVGTYRPRENEKISIEELTRFGVEPFEIKVVRATPTVSAPPTIVYKTKSVEVVSIEPDISTLPIFRVTLHNLTGKNVCALEILVVEDGKTRIQSMPQGKYGEALIIAGGYKVLREPIETSAELGPGGYAPSSAPDQQMIITSLVFEDGTYEGDVGPAATFRGFLVGRKTELKRSAELMESVLAASGNDPVDAPAKFRAQLESLSYEVDSVAFATLVKAFPTRSEESLRHSVDVAIHGMRKDLLDDLQRFQIDQPSKAADFRSWLTAERDRYSGWLARL